MANKPKTTTSPANPVTETDQTKENSTMSAATSTEPSAASAPANGVQTVKIASLDVTLPVRFVAGHVVTADEAKVLDAAYVRQFTNNQNALAKARTENLAKAKTDDERKKYSPLSAEQIAALYTDYAPSVGDTPRASAMDKMRQEAAWRFWVARAKAHNDAIAAGGEPVHLPAGKKPIDLRFNAVTDDQGKVVQSAQERKESFINRLLGHAPYAEEIQTHLDAVMAEKASAKATPPAPEAAATADIEF